MLTGDDNMNRQIMSIEFVSMLATHSERVLCQLSSRPEALGRLQTLRLGDLWFGSNAGHVDKLIKHCIIFKRQSTSSWAAWKQASGERFSLPLEE